MHFSIRAQAHADLNLSSEIKNLAHNDRPIIQTATTAPLPKNNNKKKKNSYNDGDHKNNNNNNNNDNDNSNNNKHTAVIAATVMVMVIAMTSFFIHETIDHKYYSTTSFYCS